MLPSAIEQDFVMAWCVGEEECIEVHNIDKDMFPAERLTTDPWQKLREGAHWINYFLCGYKAILATDERCYNSVVRPKGLKIFIDSLVPIAAGVSSSSAFTVCSALVTMHANGLTHKVTKSDFSKLCVAGEKLAGTACGGMDQTIAVFAEKDKVKHIQFYPQLQITDVAMPTNVSLVVANSLTPCPKLFTLGTRFNKRVVECRLACCIMCIKSGISIEKVPFKTFCEL